ncbi:hypothetical protein, partial [Salmonella enterica]
ADRNRSHWSTSKTPSYTKSVSWQHHPILQMIFIKFNIAEYLHKRYCFYVKKEKEEEIKIHYKT